VCPPAYSERIMRHAVERIVRVCYDTPEDKRIILRLCRHQQVFNASIFILSPRKDKGCVFLVARRHLQHIGRFEAAATRVWSSGAEWESFVSARPYLQRLPLRLPINRVECSRGQFLISPTSLRQSRRTPYQQHNRFTFAKRLECFRSDWTALLCSALLDDFSTIKIVLKYQHQHEYFSDDTFRFQIAVVITLDLETSSVDLFCGSVTPTRQS
jgi:hypothetical protein